MTLTYDDIELWEPRKSNCLLWAIAMRIRHGGELVAVGSLYGWWPHFLWRYQGRLYEYSPFEHQHDLLTAPIMFEGRVQTVIDEYTMRIVRAGQNVIAEKIERLRG